MKSTASETLLNQAYLLADRYRDTFELCRGKESMGWSYGSNAKGLAVPFFLMLLCKEDVNSLKNLKWIWDGAVGNAGEYYLQCDQDIQTGFRAAVDKVFESVQLSDDEASKYLDWCVDETRKRVDAIVETKHRRSYCKAVILLGALAEVLGSRGMSAEGYRLIEKYHRKYNHYSAFRKELKEATGM
ncbi:MAG: hypothetical protein DRN71_01525 [Candidatus Nanohalarchaeota archaeon]|nr:MAG: hypothetical protein DRN71_01525 [Candidatus Nanohaloarchaeota archaeon]